MMTMRSMHRSLASQLAKEDTDGMDTSAWVVFLSLAGTLGCQTLNCFYLQIPVTWWCHLVAAMKKRPDCGWSLRGQCQLWCWWPNHWKHIPRMKENAMSWDPVTTVGGCQVRGQVGTVDRVNTVKFLNIRRFGKFYWIDKHYFLQLMPFVKKFCEI